jgi:hypothetical protein
MVGDGAEDGWRGSNHLEYQQHRGIPVCLSFSRPNLRQLSWACAGTFQAWSSNTARNTPSLISRPAVLYAGRNIPYSFFWPAALYTGKNNFHITFLHCLALSALIEIFPNHFIRPFRSLHSDIHIQYCITKLILRTWHCTLVKIYITFQALRSLHW